MPEHIETIALHETARERYLNYALSVITSRALPDIRDGLKPVQRRILYGMHHGLRLTHDARYRKSAAVVGEVMAKYHPHGDQAIYDAMVRLAQDFSLRYPLVDGQGNFGSLDGDGAAAMRYTEARLRPIADEFLSEIGKNTVPFRSNYDGQTQEPCVLPAQVPNLLINGATGIAVGMATHVPPHNLREVVKALIRLIEQPDSTLDDILKLIQGPDFPTGGRLLNTQDELRAIYATGRGALKLVAEYTVEPSDDGDGNPLLVITSVPFGSDKTEILEKIAEHIQNNGLPQLLDVRDESTGVVRIVCEMAPLKSKTTAQQCADRVMAYLYKHTGLLNRFHVNLTCLVPATSPLALSTQDERDALADAIPLHASDRLEIALDDATLPAQVGLMDLLRHFLDFRFAVVTRRLRYDLERLNARIHTLRGFALIFDALDEALGLIREADGRDDAANKLIARFGLDRDQVDAILQTRLYKLARLEINAIREELAACLTEAAAIQATLDSDSAIWALIQEELRTLSRKYGDKRRTPIDEVEEAALEYSPEDYIVSEDAAAIVTREGWIKRQGSYRTLSAIRVRDNDEVGWALRASTRASIIFFSDRGQAYTMLVDQLPATSGYGDPLQAHFDFEDGERIVGVSCTDPRFERVIPGNLKAPLLEHTPAPPYVLALTRSGNAVRLPRQLFDEPSNRTGRRYIRLLDAAPDGQPDRVIKVLNCAGDEMLCVASVHGRGVAFSIQEATLLRGPGRGVNTLNLKDGDTLLDAAVVAHADKHNGLQVRKPSGKIEKVSPSRFLVGRRNAKGRAIIKRGRLEALPPTPVEVRDDDDEPDPALRRATPTPPPNPKPRASPATEREQDPNQGHLFS